jgi:hypothetical protein
MIDESLYGRLSLITVPRDVTAKDDDKLHKRQFPIASTTVSLVMEEYQERNS